MKIMNIIKTKYFINCLIIVGCISFGVGFSWYFFAKDDDGSCVTDLGLTLINKDLDCDYFDEKSQKIEILQNKLETIISVYKSSGQIKRASVFVRDLNSRRFAGVNDTDVYYMASLLKLPLVIAGFKLAEVEPKILDQEVVFKGDVDSYDLEKISKDNLLVKGNRYTVIDLMKRSVEYSSNDASGLLFDYYPREFLDRIIQALGIQVRQIDGVVENPVTARTYANVFRTLYNASYLNREYSNQTLDFLTNTIYREGALAKLPPDVIVAHKFAERIVQDENTNNVLYKQLHECGIVYAVKGKEPYTFCIMTEGDKDDDLEKIQQDISLEIYNTIIDTY